MPREKAVIPQRKTWKRKMDSPLPLSQCLDVFLGHGLRKGFPFAGIVR